MDRFDLIGLADAVTASETPTAAWAAFARHLSRDGIARAHLQLDLPCRAENPFAAHPGARSFGVFWDDTLDAALRAHPGDIRRATRRELLHIRPTLLFLSRFRTPFFIDHRHMVETAPGSPFAPICRIMLDDMGQHHALVLPLGDPATGVFSTLSLWADEPRADFPAYVRDRASALQMAGLHLRTLIGIKWPSRSAPVATARLTDRERQVLALLAGGAQVGGIADRLGLTERSVQEYLIRARRKLGARSRTEAVVRALLDGQI